MRGGLAILLSSAALAGCASTPGQVQVRAIADPLAKMGAGSERLAEARGQLLLGNVGLAIEAFHAALREKPDSVEAMNGLAACYDSMGRTDLSRHYYEAALAVAPHDARVLTAFAGSLDAQGSHAQALELRGEAAQASARVAPAPVPVTLPAPAGAAVRPHDTAVSTALAAAPDQAVQVRAPELRSEPVPVAAISAPAPAPAPVTIPTEVAAAAVVAPAAAAHDAKVLAAFTAPLEPAQASVKPVPAAEPAAGRDPEPSAITVPAVVAAAAAAVVPVTIPIALAAVAPRTDALADAGPSVTIALPPPRPAARPIAQTVVRPAEQMVERDGVQADGPRLQRLSLGEVALLTSGEPAWKPMVVARTAQSTTVHWVALKDSTPQPNVRLLNAARSQGLAARTRAYLLARGWRKIEIGDADSVRESTMVMYPAGRQATGRSLAAQFPVRAGLQQQGQVIVVLLGRDAIPGKAAQAGG